MRTGSPACRRSRGEHEEIFAALEKRDGKALAKALRGHILRAKDTLLEHTGIRNK